MCLLISAAVRASTSSKSSEAFTSSPICVSVASTSSDTSNAFPAGMGSVCVPGGFIREQQYNRRPTRPACAANLALATAEFLLAANSGNAQRNPAKNPQQIHSESQTRHNPHERSRFAAPPCPAEPQYADASAFAAAEFAANTAASVPCLECLPRQQPSSPQCSNPSLCLTSLVPTTSCPFRSSKPQ